MIRITEEILALKNNCSNMALGKVSDGQLDRIHDWISKSPDEFIKNKVENPKISIDDYNRRFQEIIG